MGVAALCDWTCGTLVSESMFFILGFPRSGTTLLRLMLTSHPDIVIPPECSFITWLAEDYDDWTKSDCFSSRKDNFINALSESRKFETWQLSSVQLGKAIESHSPTNYAELVMLVYRLFSISMGKDKALLGDKNNVYLSQIERILNHFPRAKFVWITRDVRDVCASLKSIRSVARDNGYRPQVDSNLVNEATKWSAQNLAMVELARDLGESQVMPLTYEGLVTKPIPTITKALNFLDCGWDPRVMDFHVMNAHLTLEPKATLAWKQMTLEPVSTSSVGRWRDFLTSSEVREITGSAMSAMAELGYSESST